MNVTVKVINSLFAKCILLVTVCALMVLAACSEVASTVRKVTYPPDFKYVSGQELRTNMDKLAYNLQQLDQALADSAVDQMQQQRQVLDVLRNIEKIGTGLRAGDAGSNHPFLQDYMSDFVQRVGEARIAAAQNPPHYYLAGRVSGGCISCHKVNR